MAVCSPDEALAVFEFIRNDFATAQVFLEFGREPPLPNSPRPLHAFGIGEFKRKLRLSDDRLADCFEAINQRFMRLRNDTVAVLLGFDQANHVYIHEVTHGSVRALWERLVRMEPDAEPAPTRPAAPFGFVPPQVGPQVGGRASRNTGMTSATSTTSRRQSGRRIAGRAQRDHVIDLYQAQQKLQEPTACRQCGAVYHRGRWQ